MLSSSAFITTLILHSGSRHHLINLFTFVGTLLLQALKFLGLLFARLIGVFFYLLLLTLIDFPSWLLSFRRPKPYACPECQLHQKQHQNQYQEPKKEKDKPTGWVTVKICNTDEISELNLSHSTAEHGLHRIRHPHGSWEHRYFRHVSPEEIKRRILPWLEQIAEEGSDSGYIFQEEYTEQREGLEMKVVCGSSLFLENSTSSGNAGDEVLSHPIAGINQQEELGGEYHSQEEDTKGLEMCRRHSKATCT
ncbi:uncharacterized protein PAC_17313 [Phialocephala subalpina]|uniref:Uncharacterized protein n=1 Tax=Phialocephala subalpina TaxID=576137 RepID=A0A1L7XQV1_9HELO|nr:uncharacterized protein PAC_17313 [Phialocephala subalpina]